MPLVTFEVPEICQQYMYRIFIILDRNDTKIVAIPPAIIEIKLPDLALSNSGIKNKDPIYLKETDMVKVDIEWKLPYGLKSEHVLGYDQPMIHPLDCMAPEAPLPTPFTVSSFLFFFFTDSSWNTIYCNCTIRICIVTRAEPASIGRIACSCYVVPRFRTELWKLIKSWTGQPNVVFRLKFHVTFEGDRYFIAFCSLVFNFQTYTKVTEQCLGLVHNCNVTNSLEKRTRCARAINNKLTIQKFVWP